MRTKRLGWLACALLLSGCVPSATVIPDPLLLHQLAEDAQATILVRAPGGKVEKQRVKLQAGGYYGSQQLVEGK